MINSKLINNSGNEHLGNKLKVTQDMVGDNLWTCIAKNVIKGQQYETAKQIRFKAGKC